MINCTIASLLLVKIMLRSTLHYPKSFNLILFPSQILKEFRWATQAGDYTLACSEEGAAPRVVGHLLAYVIEAAVNPTTATRNPRPEIQNPDLEKPETRNPESERGNPNSEARNSTL